MGIFRLFRFEQSPHQIHTVGNHYQDHPHVLSKRQQQVAEVLALHHRILLIELADAVETLQNAHYRRTILRLDIRHREFPFFNVGYQMNSLYRITLQTDLLCQDLGRLSSHFLLFVVCKSEFLHHIFINLTAKLQISFDKFAFFEKSY